MKEFFEPQPIEIKIKKLDGSEVILKLERITSEMLKKINNIGNRESGDILEEELSLVEMSIFFGGKPEDYKDYDIRIINNVISYISGEIGNPTEEQT